jgi:hypothetical protein
MAKTVKQITNQPGTLLVLGLVGILLAYSLFTRAVDTGSLGQYGLVILFLILSVRILIKAKHLREHGRK